MTHRKSVLSCILLLVLLAPMSLFGGMIKTPYLQSLTRPGGSKFARGTKPLLRFTKDAPPFLTKFALENWLVLSATGSGKTSAIDRTVAVAMLGRGGFGMLKTCVKNDAIEDLREWAKLAGREHDVVRVSPGGEVFDCLTWAMEMGGPTFASQMLRELRETMSRGRFTGGGGENAFFDDKSDIGNGCVIDVCHKAIGRVDADDCISIWNSIPQYPGHPDTEKTFCHQMCEKAKNNCKDKEWPQLKRSISFLLEEMVSLESRPRSSVVVTATTPWQALIRPPLCDLFLGESTITPAALDDGAIIGIDVDGKYGAAAIGANVIWKYAAEHHILTRPKPDGDEDALRPIVVFLSEGDKVLSSHDSRYSSLCRSQRGAYYMSCQSINSLFSEIGADPTGKARVMNLIGNCNTHIYGCTCDEETLSFAEKTFGEKLVIRKGGHAETEWQPFLGKVYVGDGKVSLNPVWEHEVRREHIQELVRGADSYVGAFVRTLGPRGIEKYSCLFSQDLSLQKPGFWDSITAPDSVRIL